MKILNSLNLIDYKKECLLEYENRITNFINRNKSKQIQIIISQKEIKNNIYSQNYIKIFKPKIPENYPFGKSNMETQTYFDPPTKEINDEINRVSEIDLKNLLNEIIQLNKEGNLVIIIKEL